MLDERLRKRGWLRAIPPADPCNTYLNVGCRSVLVLIAVSSVLAPSVAVAVSRAALDPVRPPAATIVHTVQRGDSFAALLAMQGVARDAIARWRQAARPHADLGRLQPGRTLQLEHDGTGVLRAVRYDLDGERVLSIERRRDGRLVAQTQPVAAIVHAVAVHAVIERTFYQAARRAAIPDAIVSQLVDVLSWTLRFESDVHRGDRVRVLYEERTTPNGRPLKPGRVIAVEYRGRTVQLAAYLYGEENGEPVYVDGGGHRLNRTPLRYPLEFSRITSTFTQSRFHPMLLQNRPHLGVDFAAPAGTPVRAIAAGTVTWSAVKGGFGNHVEIDHGGELVSAYSHLQAIDAAVQVHRRVARGQLLGWVGQTGLATGPHLHFAVFDRGEYVDPLAMQWPRPLVEVDPAAFTRLRAALSARLRGDLAAVAAAPSAPEVGLPLAKRATAGPIRLTF